MWRVRKEEKKIRERERESSGGTRDREWKLTLELEVDELGAREERLARLAHAGAPHGLAVARSRGLGGPARAPTREASLHSKGGRPPAREPPPAHARGPVTPAGHLEVCSHGSLRARGAGPRPTALQSTTGSASSALARTR